MYTTRRRRVATALATPVLMLAVAGCGGEDSGSASDETNQSSEQSEAPADSLESGDAVEPGEFTDRLAAALDEISTARSTMTLGSQGMTIESQGVVDYTGEAPAMDMTMTMGQSGEMRVILTGNVMYVSGAGLPQGKFVKVDLDDPKGPLADLGMAGLTDQMDIRRQMEQFSEGITEVTFEGTEEVDGEELSRYSVTFDASKVEALGQQAKSMGKVTFDLWLDQEDRMRQVVIDQSGTTVTMELSDYGTEADIAAPPADQVVEVPQQSRQ